MQNVNILLGIRRKKMVTERVLAAFAVRPGEAKDLDLAEFAEGTVPRRALLEHLNRTVFAASLGAELKIEKLEEIFDGLGDQIGIFLLNHCSVKLGKLGTFHPKRVPPGTRINPSTREPILHELIRVDFKPTRKMERLLRAKRD